MGSDNDGKMGAHGLPEMTEEEKGAPSLLKQVLSVIIPLAVGAGIGLVVVKCLEQGSTKLDLVTSHELHHLFLSAMVFGRCVGWLNTYPMQHKSRILRGKSGNLRANMVFYRKLNEDENSGYIGMESEGDVGKYNRANRSLTHFTENALPTAMSILLAGFVFPTSTLCLTSVYALGRILHQRGYAEGGYGFQGHAPGFILSAVADFSLQGLEKHACE